MIPGFCGGEGYRITEPDELPATLKKALSSKGPELVEVVTDPRQT